MKAILHLSGRNPGTKRAGFTLIELFVVIAAILILALMLCPALAGSRTKSQSARCLDNLRQLMAGMLLYTSDNHDFLPPNPDDANTIPGYNWCPSAAGVGQSAEFNPDILADPRRCLITTYIKTNVSLFRCPSDTRVGIYQGTDPTWFGKKVPAARSISMNGAVGTIDPGFNAGGAGHSGKPTLSVNGPWLDNAHSHIRNTPWRTYGRTSEMIAPIPARLFVLLDEEVIGLNDGGFAVGMVMAEWIDYPGSRHGMACTFAMADGHSELHKWMDPRTTFTSGTTGRPSAGVDWVWLTERTSAKAR